MLSSKNINAVILGASGYTGAELVRLLSGHPYVRIKALTAETQAGKAMAEIYPHLRVLNLPVTVKNDEVDYTGIDVVFCCLPHGTTQEIIAALPDHVRIVDLSADFRLSDVESYHQWYGHPHRASDLQKHAVYGLTEWARDDIKTARLVANPGCYPTASLLPLLPLVREKLIHTGYIGIDAMSGVSGAGRATKQSNLFTEIAGGVSAYGIGHHRHMPEIEQELSRIAGEEAVVSFTPHLVPMSRGMLATIRTPLNEGATVGKARDVLQARYEKEPFVHVLEEGEGSPSTHQVRGSNHCMISAHAGRIKGELIVISAIDNLTKGASGQAVQNMNVMFAFPETMGLQGVALVP